MIGGWPLFTQTLLTDLDPKKVKIVVGRRAAAGARRTSRRGSRRCCSRSPSYLWGYVGVQHDRRQGASTRRTCPQIIPMELVRVTKDNLGDVGAPAQGVGLHRRARRVPEAASRRDASHDASRRVRFEHITKRFPGVQALDDVSASRSPRVVPRALRRERRGKEHAREDPRRHPRARRGRDRSSTGSAVQLREPARRAGRRRRHGAPGARVLREPVGRREPLPRRAAVARGLFVDRAARCAARATRCSPRSTRRLDVRRPVGELTIGAAADGADRAAVGSGARVIVFDEPTSSLSQHEAERLYELIDRLRAARRDLHLRLHRMQEIFRLCDTVTVLRDGRHVAHAADRAS